MIRVWVPRDAAAIACGADAVAAAIGEAGRRAGVELAVVRNGSRGMLWLEPLVEVEIDGVRHGFGPLAVARGRGAHRGGRRRDRAAGIRGRSGRSRRSRSSRGRRG